MKIYNLRGYVVLLTGIALLLTTGCEGPEGPTGPQGLQGAQGPQGEQGAQGPPGTANVYYSDWTAFDASNWSDAYSRFGQMRRDYPIDESLVDEEFLTMGTVAVYVRIPTSAGDSVFPLPWISHITKGLQQVLNFDLLPGQIIINFFDLVDDSVDPGSFGGIAEHRYVIIPGEVLTKVNMPDLSDYNSVLNYYGIDP